MITPVHQCLRERLAATLETLYHLRPDELPQLALEYPPTRELGDLATPAAFELARRLRKAPRAIAQEIAGALGPIPGVSRVEAAAERLSQHLSGSSGVRAGAARRDKGTGVFFRSLGRKRLPSPFWRQDHHRAHRHQSEQGGAHRAHPQLRARRHARARPAVPRRARGGAELHRRHRRAGGGRRRGLPRARAGKVSKPSARSPIPRGSTTTAGISTRASRAGTTKTRSG